MPSHRVALVLSICNGSYALKKRMRDVWNSIFRARAKALHPIKLSGSRFQHCCCNCSGNWVQRSGQKHWLLHQSDASQIAWRSLPEGRTLCRAFCRELSWLQTQQKVSMEARNPIKGNQMHRQKHHTSSSDKSTYNHNHSHYSTTIRTTSFESSRSCLQKPCKVDSTLKSFPVQSLTKATQS